MKRIFTLSIISGSLILTSCSLSRNTSMSSNPGYQKLEAKQALVDMPANQKTVSSDNNACKNVDPLVVNKDEASAVKTVKSAPPIHKVTFARNNFVRKSGQLLAKNISISNLDKKTSELLSKTNSPTTAWDPGSMSADHYLRLWIICGIAFIVFLVLGGIFVHILLLYSILGILALLALVGFLLFLGLWFWRKKRP